MSKSKSYFERVQEVGDEMVHATGLGHAIARAEQNHRDGVPYRQALWGDVATYLRDMEDRETRPSEPLGEGFSDAAGETYDDHGNFIDGETY